MVVRIPIIDIMLNICAILFFAVAFAYVLPIYRKRKSMTALILTILDCCAIIGSGIALSGSFIPQSEGVLITYFNRFLQYLMLLLLLIYIDSVMRDRIDAIKLVVAFTLMGFNTAIDTVVLVYPLYDITQVSQIELIIQVGVLLYVLLSLVRVAFLIFKQSPDVMKRDARWVFTGSILSISFAFFSAYPISIPTSQGTYNLWLAGILNSISFLFISYGFHKSPELMHVLPFKAVRLSVINTQAGIAIYTHTWQTSEKMVDDDLFSGMIQGISMIVKESVGKGEVKELLVDQGVFIFSRDVSHSLAFVLVASKSSKILRDSLSKFGTQFVIKFEVNLLNPTEVSQFSTATDLVNTFFPYFS